MDNFKIKVCGMKYPENIGQLATLPIDYIGFIFYDKSPRYVKEINIPVLPASICKVGVFVDELPEKILDAISQFKLDAVQLHGNESPETCKELKKSGLQIIKAFGISKVEDFEQTSIYEGSCDYFLFDTKTQKHGGSGEKFDWRILSAYTGQTPFFLSGGISPEDAESIRKIKHEKLYALDLNSRFETEPGRKNIELIKTFIENI